MTDAIPDPMNQRQHQRFSCDMPASLVTRCGDIGIEVKGRIVNYSEGGYGFVGDTTYTTLAGIQAPMTRPYRCHNNDLVDLVINDIKQPVQVRWSDHTRVGLMVSD